MRLISKKAKSLAALLLTLAFGAAVATAAPLEAKITAVTGKVELKQGESWKQLKAGDTLKKGDVISTGFKSSATIKINSSTVEIGALTRITLDELASSSSRDSTKIHLESGSVQADVKHPNSKKVDFSVSTPVATASVRGTKIGVNSRGDAFTSEGSMNYHKTTESDREASVFEDDDNNLETPESTIFTDAKEIGGTAGITVFAGQGASTDAYTMEQGGTRESFASATTVNATGITSLADQETASFTASKGNSGGKASAANDATKGTFLVIDIEFE